MAKEVYILVYQKKEKTVNFLWPVVMYVLNYKHALHTAKNKHILRFIF